MGKKTLRGLVAIAIMLVSLGAFIAQPDHGMAASPQIAPRPARHQLIAPREFDSQAPPVSLYPSLRHIAPLRRDVVLLPAVVVAALLSVLTALRRRNLLPVCLAVPLLAVVVGPTRMRAPPVF